MQGKDYELMKDDLVRLGVKFINTMLQTSSPKSVENYLVKDLEIKRENAKEIIKNELTFQENKNINLLKTKKQSKADVKTKKSKPLTQ